MGAAQPSGEGVADHSTKIGSPGEKAAAAKSTARNSVAVLSAKVADVDITRPKQAAVQGSKVNFQGSAEAASTGDQPAAPGATDTYRLAAASAGGHDNRLLAGGAQVGDSPASGADDVLFLSVPSAINAGSSDTSPGSSSSSGEALDAPEQQMPEGVTAYLVADGQGGFFQVIDDGTADGMLDVTMLRMQTPRPAHSAGSTTAGSAHGAPGGSTHGQIPREQHSSKVVAPGGSAHGQTTREQHSSKGDRAAVNFEKPTAAQHGTSSDGSDTDAVGEGAPDENAPSSSQAVKLPAASSNKSETRTAAHLKSAASSRRGATSSTGAATGPEKGGDVAGGRDRITDTEAETGVRSGRQSSRGSAWGDWEGRSRSQTQLEVEHTVFSTWDKKATRPSWYADSRSVT